MMAQLLNALPHIAQCLPDAYKFVSDRRVGDGENTLFRLVQKILKVKMFLISQLADGSRRFNKFAHHRFPLNDMSIMRQIGRRGDRVHQLGEIATAADAVKHASFFEFRGKRQEVNRLAFAEKFHHSLKDKTMLIRVERIRSNDIHNVGNPLRLQHNRPQERLL